MSITLLLINSLQYQDFLSGWYVWKIKGYVKYEKMSKWLECMSIDKNLNFECEYIYGNRNLCSDKKETKIYHWIHVLVTLQCYFYIMGLQGFANNTASQLPLSITPIVLLPYANNNLTKLLK